MIDHLSHERFARCFVGDATNAERQHILNCPQCSAELTHFGSTISSLRQAIRGRVKAQVSTPISRPPATDYRPRLRWALAAAAILLLGTAPFLTRTPAPKEETAVDKSPEASEALMNAINTHLSRTIPSPMEPMMSLIPSNENGTE